MKIPPRILEHYSYYLFNTPPSVNKPPQYLHDFPDTHWHAWIWREWCTTFAYLIEQSDANTKE
jgi:hypothetical protein